MPNLSTGGGGGYDYVQGETPNQPDEGEEWYATGSGSQDQGAYVFNGAEWIEETVTDHSQLSGVSSSTHHRQTTAGTGLAFDSEMAEIYARLGHLLTTDADGQIAVQEGNITLSDLSGYPVEQGDLGFNPATQDELVNSLSNHADQEAAHHEPVPNEPGWTEDPNSPFSADGVTSATLQLADSYDRVMIDFGWTNRGENRVGLRVNGATSGYYTYRSDGAEYNPSEQFYLMSYIPSDGTGTGTVRLRGSSNSVTCEAKTGTAGSGYEYFPRGCEDASGQISQVTFLSSSGSSFDLETTRVWGRNL